MRPVGANEVRGLAFEAKTEADRLALLELAKRWLETASREDNKTSEQAAAAQKP